MECFICSEIILGGEPWLKWKGHFIIWGIKQPWIVVFWKRSLVKM